MQPSLVIYYCLLLLAALLTIPPARRDRRLWFFFAVLATALLEELVFEFLLLYTGKKYFLIYHLYAPLYYSLFALYFYFTIPTKAVTRFIPWSIAFYCCGSALAWWNGGGLFLFPGLKIDILGFLLIPLCFIALYTLDAQDHTPITSRPLFWVSIATFIFYTSDFVVIGLKSYIGTYSDQRAKNVTTLLNFINNYLYYTIISIGMIWARPVRKFSQP